MGSAANLVGCRFGRLTVTSLAGRNRHGALRWSAACDCGKTIITTTGSLTSENTTSCGCTRTKHGQARTPLYRLWSGMIARCERPTATGYKHYGGRGIRVCPTWRASFETFSQDMGPRPPGTSLDRIDPNGNYEPSNCRWATNREQALNKRNNHLITAHGITRTLTEWSAVTGIGVTTIRERLRRGWDALRAVTP